AKANPTQTKKRFTMIGFWILDLRLSIAHWPGSIRNRKSKIQNGPRDVFRRAARRVHDRIGTRSVERLALAEQFLDLRPVARSRRAGQCGPALGGRRIGGEAVANRAGVGSQPDHAAGDPKAL